MGDLEWEAAKVDADRIRGGEAARPRAAGGVPHRLRHDATGRLVAWTTIDFGATPDWHAFQQITIVDPDHRGHRLGVLVKVENLRSRWRPSPRCGSSTPGTRRSTTT